MTRLQRWAWYARLLWQHGRPERVFSFRGGLGDDLLCTAPIHEWLERGARRIWFISRYPSLHRFDRRVRVLPETPESFSLAAKLGRPARFLSYSRYDAETDRDTPLARPLIAEMCSRAGLSGEIELRPHLTLSHEEREAAADFKGALVVQSSGLAAAVPMRNKQWPVERVQKTVDAFRGQLPIVQIGSAREPLLDGVIDRRGLPSLRQSAAVLGQARLFFGVAGFLMHLARAVDCPSVVVYGGREPAELTGYPCNLNLANTPPCSPCWQRNRCDHQLACMDGIPVERAVEAIRSALERKPELLSVAKYTL